MYRCSGCIDALGSGRGERNSYSISMHVLTQWSSARWDFSGSVLVGTRVCCSGWLMAF